MNINEAYAGIVADLPQEQSCRARDLPRLSPGEKRGFCRLAGHFPSLAGVRTFLAVAHAGKAADLSRHVPVPEREAIWTRLAEEPLGEYDVLSYDDVRTILDEVREFYYEYDFGAVVSEMEGYFVVVFSGIHAAPSRLQFERLCFDSGLASCQPPDADLIETWVL